MLYLDYSRKAGEWVPNVHGGNEDLDAIAFLKQLNEVAHGREPGLLMAAEESTAWPGVSRPVYLGGLGFGLKWNMGWMHDTLAYFQRDPVYRRHHHHQLTFSLVYAFSENFVLPLSHDEVVHGKGSLLAKMPGDPWQQRANLRALYAYMWAHPGKKLLFMGGELGQESEWRSERLARLAPARAAGALRHPVARPRPEPALPRRARPVGGRLRADRLPLAGAERRRRERRSSFMRLSKDGKRQLVCACNFSPVPRQGYRIGLPRAGRWRELVNTDSELYGGSGVGNMGGVTAEEKPWHDQPYSAEVTLPPLGVVWLVPSRLAPARRSRDRAGPRASRRELPRGCPGLRRSRSGGRQLDCPHGAPLHGFEEIDSPVLVRGPDPVAGRRQRNPSLVLAAFVDRDPVVIDPPHVPAMPR